MRKMVCSTLLLFFYSQLFAQNITTKESIALVPDHESSTASSTSASILKLNVFAPLLGYSQFSWEKSVNRLRDLEFGLGIIGAGKYLNIQARPLITLSRDPIHYLAGHKNQFGGFVEFGYKFIKPVRSAERFSHDDYTVSDFEGSYIKPSILAGAYNFNQFSTNTTTATFRNHHRFGALMLNIGHQWVYDSKIVLEIYMGGGAEIDNVKEGDDLYGHPFVLAVAKDILQSSSLLPLVFVWVFFFNKIKKFSLRGFSLSFAKSTSTTRESRRRVSRPAAKRFTDPDITTDRAIPASVSNNNCLFYNKTFHKAGILRSYFRRVKSCS